RLNPLTVRALRPGKVGMVKEERSLRTRLGPVRSGALRGALSDDFLPQAAPVQGFAMSSRRSVRLPAARSLTRLNASMKPTHLTRSHRDARPSADARPALLTAVPLLVVPRPSPRARWTSPASAARERQAAR